MTDPLPLVKDDLEGRTVTVKLPDLAQLGLLQHQARILTRSEDNAELQRALELSFRVLFSLFPEKEDLHHVEDLVADGTLDVVGLTQFVIGAGKKMKEEQLAEAPRAVRRGRPRKAA